jgi:hypothetical protein
MDNAIKPFQYLIHLPIGLISLFIFVNWGWLGYSTLTERPGLWGSWHVYYHLSKTQFSSYCLFVALSSLFFIIAPIIFMIKGDRKKLLTIYRCFVAFLLIVIVLELWLYTSFEAKG